jgi:hypothetical protein
LFGFLQARAVPLVGMLRGMDLRTIQVSSSKGGHNEYVRVVEAYREGGKVKQRTVADLGRKDLLVAILPRLERVLKGQPGVQGRGDDLEVLTWGPLLVVRQLFHELRLWPILDELLGHSHT